MINDVTTRSQTTVPHFEGVVKNEGDVACRATIKVLQGTINVPQSAFLIPLDVGSATKRTFTFLRTEPALNLLQIS